MSGELTLMPPTGSIIIDIKLDAFKFTISVS